MNHKTYVIIHILPTNMQERSAEIHARHLHRVVQRPQSSAETLTYTREPTATGRVGLEHVQRLSSFQRQSRCICVARQQIARAAVIEEGGECFLRIVESTELVFGEAVVYRISGRMSESSFG